jgi:hypothetical protein
MGPSANAESPLFFPPFRLDGNRRQREHRPHFVQVACSPWLPVAGDKGKLRQLVARGKRSYEMATLATWI